MRGLFGNWGRVGFYALGVAALLVIGATVFFGTSALRSEENPLERAATPTVSDQEAPKKVEKTDEKKEEEKKESEEPKEEPKEEVAATDQYQEEQAAAAQYEEPEVETPDLAAAPADGTLYLTVPKMGRYNDLVVNDMSEATLDQGAGKLPTSGFPWEPGSNTYIAAHVLGWEGTNSWLQFANLPNMAYGDLIYLSDSAGTVYTYEVTEILTVAPTDVWVAAPQPGRDMVSLQTCVGANYEWRLIVRGDRVA